MKNEEMALLFSEATPYIQKYHGKTLVIKYGGNAMVNDELKLAVMNDLVTLTLLGVRVVLVHGGGPAINTMLKKVGKESKFVNGLRYTDKETMAIRYTDFAAQAAKQSSEREVIAVQIERKAEDCYKAEYARRHLGECYEGIISGVTQRGLFVELENGVEGFVPASSLTATGTNLTEGIRLSDPVSGKNWNLGDSMMITIVRADVNLGKVDFEVAPENKQ